MYCNNLLIPRQFQIGGQTIKVRFRDDLESEEGSIGKTVYAKNEIQLQKSCLGNELSMDYILSSFFHELIHVILREMSEEGLNNNERFINIFASFLHQALKTSEY